MSAIGFKAAGCIDKLAVSRDGRLLAAADHEEHIYVFDLENNTLLLEEQVDMDIENGFHFSRSGSRLFVDDGIVLRAFSLPDLTEISLDILNEVEDVVMPTLLDTTPDDEALLRDNNGYVYILDASCTRCDSVAALGSDTGRMSTCR